MTVHRVRRRRGALVDLVAALALTVNTLEPRFAALEARVAELELARPQIRAYPVAGER